MDVFAAFTNSPYTFLELAQGGVLGNSTVAEYETTGVFKEREDMVVNGNMETMTADATLHVRPDESFLASVNNYMVGHGIRAGGRNYRVIGQTGGQNYHTGQLEHYRVTLKRESLVEDGS